MALTAVTETAHGPEFLLSEASGKRSRENVVVAASQTLKAGNIVGKITEGAKVATAANGVPAPAGATMSAVTAALNTKLGEHTFTAIVGGAAAASRWRHEDPDGLLIGTAIAGTAYAGGGLSALTITDSGTDPTPGETFVVTVTEPAAGSGQIVMHDPEALNGSQTAYGVITSDVTTAAGETAKAVVIARDAEVISARLVWDDQDATEKAAALATLALAGVIAR